MKKDKKEKKSPREKKVSTHKKPFSKKITGINTTSNISYGNVDVNPKDRRVKFLFGAAIITLLAVGIGVPLGIAGVQYVTQLAYGDTTSPIFPNGPSLDDLTDKPTKEVQAQKDAEVIETAIVKELYGEERNAFLKFEAFINATKYKDTDDRVGSTTFGVDVSVPYKEVVNKKTKELDKAKKAMRESYPTEWQTKWKAELKTETYGNSSTEKEAVDFLVTEATRAAAFARYNTTEINTTSWTMADLTLRAESNISYKLDDETTGTIFAGTRLLSDFFIETQNYAIPTNVNPTTPPSEVNISVYQSKSYVPTERNAATHLPKLYNDYYKSANISSVSIPFVQNSENSDLDLVVTPELLIKLFTANRIEGGDIITPFTSISNFKGANSNSSLTEQNTDKAILNIMSSESTSPEGDQTTREPATTGSSLGSSKVTSLSTLITSGEEGAANEKRSFNIAAISADITPTIENDALFKMDVSNPINLFLKSILKSNPDAGQVAISKLIEHLNLYFVVLEEKVSIIPESFESGIAKFNKDTIKLIEKIPSKDFTIFFNPLLSSSFGTTTGTDEKPIDGKKWTTYQLELDTFLYVDAKGLIIYNIQKLYDNININNPAQKMLMSDIQNTIDVINNPGKVVLYDIATEYNKIATPDIINLMEIGDRIEFGLEPIPNKPEITQEQRVKDVKKYLTNNVENVITPDITSALSGLPLYLEEIIKPMNSYDFEEIIDTTTEMVLMEFKNGLSYKNGSLKGQQLIESEFYDKLKKIITIKIKVVEEA